MKKLLFGLLLVLGLILTLPTDAEKVSAATYTVGGQTFDTASLTVQTSGTAYGVTYQIYTNGFCILTGSPNQNWGNWNADQYVPWRSTANGVKYIYCNINCNGKGLGYFFNKISTLEAVSFGSIFTNSTSTCTNMGSMFNECRALTDIDVSA